MTKRYSKGSGVDRTAAIKANKKETHESHGLLGRVSDAVSGVGHKIAEASAPALDKVGGVLEGIGHKISDAGAPALGKKIHDLGDKLEAHHDNENHPHQV